MNPFFEARAWRIATQLVRRAPTDLQLFESDFQGGHYRFLSIVSTGISKPIQAYEQRLVDVNLLGEMIVLPGRELPEDLDARAKDPELLFDRAPSFYRDLAKGLNLPDPQPLPPSTRSTLAYRFIVAWLQLQTSRGYRHTVYQGVDPSGRVRAPLFAAFADPDLAQLTSRSPEHAADLHQWHPAHDYWIMAADEVPIACVGNDAIVRTPDGSRFDVRRLYNDGGRRIWAAVAAVRSHVEGSE